MLVIPASVAMMVAPVKKHALWLILAVAAFLIAVGYRMRRPPAAPPPAPQAASTPVPSKSPFAPPPNQAAPPKPPVFVAIEDGKTIDFSKGIPIVKDTAAEKAIIAKAVKEMEDAMQGVTFPPPGTPTPTEPKKAAEPAKK